MKIPLSMGKMTNNIKFYTATTTSLRTNVHLKCVHFLDSQMNIIIIKRILMVRYFIWERDREREGMNVVCIKLWKWDVKKIYKIVAHLLKLFPAFVCNNYLWYLLNNNKPDVLIQQSVEAQALPCLD